MNLNNPSKEDLRTLLASCDDDEGHHLLWVSHEGDVHIELIKSGITPIGFNCQPGSKAKFRYEVWVAGNQYCGPEATQDDGYVDWLFNELVEDWEKGRTGFIDY